MTDLILNYQIVGIILAVLGFIILSFGVFKRQQWIRLYQNLVYMKKQREHTLKDAQKGQPKPSGKFNKLKK